MNVYVEYVLLDNFAMDGLILYLVCQTLRLNVRWYRIALGALVGSVTAILTVTLYGAWLYVAKLLSLLLMCIATVGFGKKLFWHILLTLAYTFMLGGAIVGLFNLSTNDLTGGIIYQSDVPLFVYLLAIFLVVFIVNAGVNYVKDVKKVAPNLCKVLLTLDKQYRVSALWDSGNCATHNNLPLCFVSKRFSKVFAERLLSNKTERAEIFTVMGSCQVMVTKGEIDCNGNRQQVYFALGKTTALYDVILSNQVELSLQKPKDTLAKH